MKHLKMYELYSTPNLTEPDIEKMVEYIEEYSKKNGYDIYRQPKMDMSRLMDGITKTNVNDDDPFGEDAHKITLTSTGIIVFEDDSNDAKKVLAFAWMSDGRRCSNQLFIKDSKFENIDFELLKQLIEK